MGDVYDALNRGRESDWVDNDPAAPPPRRETGGLPMDEVDQAARRRPGDSIFQAHAIDRAFALPAAASAPIAPRRTGVVRDGCAPRVVAHTDRAGSHAEQYRQLRARIVARSREKKYQTHLVTSAAPREGRSTTCVNLGVIFAEMRDCRTLLIEADLRRPSFQEIFQCPLVTGLTHVLRGDLEDESEAVHQTAYDNLHIMPAGEAAADQAAELLGSRAMVRLLDRVKDRYDYLFIDSPSAATVADAAVVGALCDQTLLVVRMNQTPRPVVVQARRQLEAAGCRIAGTILTHAQANQPPIYEAERA